MNNKRLAYVLVAALALACAIATSACSGTNLDAKAIEDKYGVSGAATENILTADGAMMSATVVPVTLPDGRKAQLVIPRRAAVIRYICGIRPACIKSSSKTAM